MIRCLYYNVVVGHTQYHPLSSTVSCWVYLAPERVDRLIASALHTHEERFYAAIVQRLSTEVRQRLDALLSDALPMTGEPPEAPEAGEEPQPQHPAWVTLKSGAGKLGKKSVQREVDKLKGIQALDLPADLFTSIAPKVLDSYKLRASVEDLAELRRHPDAVRYTLLAAYCWLRRAEIVDKLLDMLIDLVQKIGNRAEKKIAQELLGDVEVVENKHKILLKLAEAAVATPDGTIRDVLFPVVPEQTLQNLIKELKSKGPQYLRQLHERIRKPYSNHYRSIVPLIVEVLDFHSNNDAHQPIIQALDLIKRHAASKAVNYPAEEEVPLKGVVKAGMQAVLFEGGGDEHQATAPVNRINYEICVLQTLREKLRTKEVWVGQANRYRNPDHDVPQDFSEKRTTYFEALHQPQEAQDFIARLKAEMREWLGRLDQAMPRLAPDIRLLPRSNGWIGLPSPPWTPSRSRSSCRG